MRKPNILAGFALLFLVFFITLPVYGEMCSTDTDGDGWADGYETKLGSDPDNPGSIPVSLDDPDQDGLKNVEERDAGTDPMDPDTDNDRLSDAQEVGSIRIPTMIACPMPRKSAAELPTPRVRILIRTA